MILYTKNPEVSIKIILEQTNKFNKVAGHKINIWKAIVFVYINAELSKRESKKANFLLNLIEKNKYLGKPSTCLMQSLSKYPWHFS